MICVLPVEWEVSEVFRSHFGHRIPQNCAQRRHGITEVKGPTTPAWWVWMFRWPRMGHSDPNEPPESRPDGAVVATWPSPRSPPVRPRRVVPAPHGLLLWHHLGSTGWARYGQSWRTSWPRNASPGGGRPWWVPLVMAVAHIQCEGGAYYGPHEMRTKYHIKTKNGNAMAYDASVGKAFYKASEKAVGEGFKL